jgi:hypothetical protein
MPRHPMPSSPNAIQSDQVIPNAAFFFAAEEPVLSEAEGISMFSAVERQPQGRTSISAG